MNIRNSEAEQQFGAIRIAEKNNYFVFRLLRGKWLRDMNRRDFRSPSHIQLHSTAKRDIHLLITPNIITLSEYSQIDEHFLSPSDQQFGGDGDTGTI